MERTRTVPTHGRSADGILHDLASCVGGAAISVDPDITAAYRADHAMLAPSATPLAVVHARSIDDVVAVVRLANEHRTPVVTRGAGSGLSGGANAIAGCIVLDLARMDEILAIDAEARTARVQPGVINDDLDAACARHGLWYAPDPASKAFSTIGGNVATNAGGACCVKYGVTGDHVAALTVVTGAGELVSTGRATRKNAAGYDLVRLLVGSEGTLGVIVEVTVRLLPRPTPPATLVAQFDTVAAAGEAVLRVGEVARPSAVELMDRVTVAAVEQLTHMQLDDCAAMLFVQCDGHDRGAEIELVSTACSAAGATFVVHTTNAVEGDMLMHARRSALPALERLGSVLLDDVCVPLPRLPDFLHDIEMAAAHHGVMIATFGHAGDGNLHPSIVFDGADEREEARARGAFDEILAMAVACGGTITGEHGVGALKTPHLAMMLSAGERALMRGIKSVFDPNGILNPGRAL